MPNEWEQSDAGLLLRRRLLLQGASAAAVSLLLPGRADAQGALGAILRAIPWRKIGEYVAEAAIGWGVGKVLDHFWEHPSSPKANDILPYIDHQQNWVTTTSRAEGGIEGRFGLRMNKTVVEAKKPKDADYQSVPTGLITAMDNIQLDSRIDEKYRSAASPDEAFRYWGVPTSDIVGCPVTNLPNGGTLVGLWWGQDAAGRRRFVVVRETTTYAGYIPCLHDYAERAHRVVKEGRLDLAGGRLKSLIETPAAFKYVWDDDAPSQA